MPLGCFGRCQNKKIIKQPDHIDFFYRLSVDSSKVIQEATAAANRPVIHRNLKNVEAREDDRVKLELFVVGEPQPDVSLDQILK